MFRTREEYTALRTHNGIITRGLEDVVVNRQHGNHMKLPQSVWFLYFYFIAKALKLKVDWEYLSGSGSLIYFRLYYGRAAPPILTIATLQGVSEN